MNTPSRHFFCITLFALLTLTAFNPRVHAAQDPVEVAFGEPPVNEEFYQQLKQQIERHKTLKPEELSDEVLTSLYKTEDNLKQNGLLTKKLEKKIDRRIQIAQQILDEETKNKYIKQEEKDLASMEHRANYRFIPTKSVLGTMYIYSIGNSDSLWRIPIFGGSILSLPVTVTIDLLSLPGTAIATKIKRHLQKKKCKELQLLHPSS